jgi:hypothetical protein
MKRLLWKSRGPGNAAISIRLCACARCAMIVTCSASLWYVGCTVNGLQLSILWAGIPASSRVSQGCVGTNCMAMQ